MKIKLVIVDLIKHLDRWYKYKVERSLWKEAYHFDCHILLQGKRGLPMRRRATAASIKDIKRQWKENPVILASKFTLKLVIHEGGNESTLG